MSSCCHFAVCVFYFLFSSYKRYFYCHDTTGITRWDYPDGPEPDNHTGEEQHRDAENEAASDTIEYQTIETTSTPSAGQSSSVVVFPGQPLPPGVEPPVPGVLSADILALAGRPPPPPPVTPPTGSDEVGTNEELTIENGLNQPVDNSNGSTPSDEEPLLGSAVLDLDPADRHSVVEISAPPVLNRPPSPEMTGPSAVIATSATECAEVSSPTTDVTWNQSPAHRGTSPTHRGSSPSISTTTDDTSVHHHRERRKKKDKVTAVPNTILTNTRKHALIFHRHSHILGWGHLKIELMTLKFELGRYFYIVHLPTKFHPKFNRSGVIMLSNKQ